MHHDEPRIQDGPGFGRLLQSARLDHGLSETELARAMNQAYPDSATTHSWIVWAEAGRVPSIGFGHVVAAAMALNVPVSSLVPAPSNCREKMGPADPGVTAI